MLFVNILLVLKLGFYLFITVFKSLGSSCILNAFQDTWFANSFSQLWACLFIFKWSLFKKKIHLFFGCAGSLLLCMGFLQLWRGGFSLHWLLFLQNVGFSSVAYGLRSCGFWALEDRLHSCSEQAQPLHMRSSRA